MATQIPPPIESVEEALRAFDAKRDEASESDGEDEDGEEVDPYEVRDAAYRRVSNEEFTQSQVVPIDRSLSFHFSDFVQLANRLHTEPPDHVNPQDYWTHDPMRLVAATAIACNIERWALLTASYVPYSELQTLEDYDTTRVLQYMKNNPQAKAKVQEMTGELIYSLMSVDMATRRLPPHIAAKIGA